MASLKNTSVSGDKYSTQSVSPGHRQSIRRAWCSYSRHVITSNPNQFPSEGCRRSITLLKAQRLAWCIVTAKRRSGYDENPLNVAHDMAIIANDAPRNCQCQLDRLDFERIAVDMMHLARERGAAA